MRFSDQELESLLGDLESDRTERKESYKGDGPERGEAGRMRVRQRLAGAPARRGRIHRSPR